MFLIFVAINLFVVASANPFHKYPYVFLLDVGNEEIQNTISEQIRVSIPGSSLALKYPAVPGRDVIAHVRVSGIDFGTDLKANVVDGGPGYNYVVLVFMGNPGATYDAVITIEFVDSTKNDSSETDINEDANNSAEDVSDELDSSGAYSEKRSKEEMVGSSNVYKYVNKEVSDTEDEDDEQSDNDAVENSDSDSDESDSDENSNDDKESDELSLENYSSEYNSDETNLKNQVRSKYVSYESFQPRLYGGIRIYPQAGLYVDDPNSRPAYDPENHELTDQDTVYDDSSDKMKESNNNIPLDYSLPLEK